MSCLPKSFDLVNLLSQKLEKFHFIREAPRPSAKFRHFVGFWRANLLNQMTWESKVLFYGIFKASKKF